MEIAKNIFMTEINDIYFVSEYFKRIFPSCRLCYLHDKNLYALYNFSSGQIELTYQRYPDSGMIEKFYRTLSENADKYLKEIEDDNLRKANLAEQATMLKAKDQLNEVISYAASKASGEISQKQIRKIVNKESKND